MPLTSNDAPETRGREYLRVSVDHSGVETSPTDQHAAHGRTAARMRVRLLEPYKDIGSASRHARKRRADFDRLLADLENGNFGADWLIMWENSRGSRKESEWMRLIELCEEMQVKIWIETDERLYDCSDDRDRRDLLLAAVDSAWESAKISKRTTRGTTSAAAAGRPHGQCNVGYRRIYSAETGKYLRQEIDPEKAPLIRELFARVRRGHAFKALERDWKTRGILNASGKPYSASQLRTMALNPAYAGLRAHSPGRKPGQPVSPDAVVVPASWPAIVPKPMFFAVAAKLRAPERKTYRDGAAKHLFSIMARCHVCGGPLTMSFAKVADGEYRCPTGCVRMRRRGVDETVERIVLRFLANPDAYGALTVETDDGDAELAALQERITKLRAELAELAEAVATGRLSVSFAAATEPGMLAELKKAEKRERELMTPSVLAGLIEPGVDVAKRWKAAEPATRREVSRLLLVPDVLGQLRVRPLAAPGQRVPAPERLAFRRLVDGELVDILLADLLV